MITRKSIGLLALLAALFALAVGASGAAATIVTPPSTGITATSTSTAFLPENAYSAIFVRCTSATAKFTVPPGRPKGGTTKVGIDQNVNRPAIGTRSTGNGGVTMDLTEPPTFTGCQTFNGTEVLGSATVKTNSTNGAWSLTGNGITTTAGDGAIGVPKAGATIETLGVVLTISPAEATAVFAPEYKNATKELKVDSQIAFSGGAGVGLVSPAQFEAVFTANNSFEINP
jgi:hypothetical protein